MTVCAHAWPAAGADEVQIRYASDGDGACAPAFTDLFSRLVVYIGVAGAYELHRQLVQLLKVVARKGLLQTHGQSWSMARGARLASVSPAMLFGV